MLNRHERIGISQTSPIFSEHCQTTCIDDSVKIVPEFRTSEL